MDPQEAARRHERQREQKDAGIAAPVRSLTPRVPEQKRRCARDPEDHEVEWVVLDVRVEPRAKQKRDEPDQRQRGGDEPAGNDSSRARSLPVCAERQALRALVAYLITGVDRVPSASSDVDRAGATRIVAASDSSCPYAVAGRSVSKSPSLGIQ